MELHQSVGGCTGEARVKGFGTRLSSSRSAVSDEIKKPWTAAGGKRSLKKNHTHIYFVLKIFFSLPFPHLFLSSLQALFLGTVSWHFSFLVSLPTREVIKDNAGIWKVKMCHMELGCTVAEIIIINWITKRTTDTAFHVQSHSLSST